MHKIIFTFKSSRMAIKADTLCSKNSLKAKVVMVPVEVSSECGMALEVEENMSDEAALLFENNKIEFKIYDRSTQI